MNLDALVGARIAFGDLIGGHLIVMAAMLGLLLLLVVLQALLRREWAAALAMVILLGAQVVLALGSEANSPGAWLIVGCYAAVSAGIIVYVILTQGFLAAVVMTLVQNLLITAPVTLDMRMWYAATGVFYLAVVGALGLYGFWAARGGEALLGEGLLGD